MAVRPAVTSGSPKLQAFLSRQPPPILYHYTSAAGLYGILTTQSLNATKVQYLNDSQEYRQALSYASDYLTQKAAAAPDSDYRAFLLSLEKSLGDSWHPNVCTFSLTSKGDLLSQWRAYCPPEGGYSIGFQTAGLLRSLSRQELTFGPCTYDEAEHRQLTSEAVEAALPHATLSLPAGVSPGALADRVLQTDLWLRLAIVAPFIKHPSFSEENEWRIVSRAVSDMALNYRASHSMLVPYLTINPSGTADKFLLSEVIVGPTPHAQLASYAVHGLLSKTRVGPVKIIQSKIPYRQI